MKNVNTAVIIFCPIWQEKGRKPRFGIFSFPGLDFAAESTVSEADQEGRLVYERAVNCLVQLRAQERRKLRHDVGLNLLQVLVRVPGVPA